MQTCPECGAANAAGARTCHLCGALLNNKLALRPRMQEKLLQRTDFMAAARANVARTNRLVFALTAVAVTLGYLVGWFVQIQSGALPPAYTSVWFFSAWGSTGAAIMAVLSLLWTAVAFKSGDRIIIRMTAAHEVTPEEEPQLHNVVEEMALASGLPKPKVLVIETPALNAFATGMRPEHAAIGVTRGLLTGLNRDELQGVIGHEMGHIANWDIRYATAVSILVGLIALVSDGVLRTVGYGGRGRRRSGDGGGILAVVMILFAILAPLFAMLVQMAVSRQREFLADASSVRFTRHPEGLISALQKLADAAQPFDGANRATQHLFIINPFRSFGEKASALMATHPPIERRIARLRNLGAE